MATKTKPFQVTRIPSLNGEWIDLHKSEAGNICIDTSAYAEVDPKDLIAALEMVATPNIIE
ncbi:MAG TPA: hypothetical protein VK963_03665 [Candidatus Saccharimonadales bacterium]|nr:hypothetical protein [Candidatus Saccharimonadales bacterium]